MSDEAAAPTEAPTDSAETQAPVETKAPKAEPKPRTIDDDLEDVLKKHGGYKYKAGGKEKSVTAASDLKRVLSFADGANEAADRAAKDKSEAASLRATLGNIAKLPPRERLSAMQSAGIDPKVIREAVEESILEEDEKAKSQAHLSPRERELQAALEKRDAEIEAFRQKDESSQKEQEEQAYVARVQQVGQRLEKLAVGALQKAGVSPEHSPHFLRTIADRFNRNEALGLELDEADVADAVMQEQGSMADKFYGGLEIPALAERLGAIEVEDPTKPGQKISRLKLLMRHEAARIKAQMNGSPPIVRQTNGHAPEPQGESKADLLSFWRR